MSKIKLCLTIVLMAVTTSPIYAQALTPDQKKQRIAASYRIVTGRQPLPGETTHWLNQADLTVQQLVDYHMQYAGKEPSFKKQIIELSYKHGLGRAPSSDGKETAWWMSQVVQTYQQMMKNHINWLDQNKAKTNVYKDVINLAYQKVYGRPATEAEKTAWNNKSTASYAMLVSALKDYAAKGNQGVLGQITNIANSFMTAIPLTDNPTIQQVINILGNTPQGKVLAEGTGSITSTIGTLLPFFNL